MTPEAHASLLAAAHASLQRLPPRRRSTALAALEKLGNTVGAMIALETNPPQKRKYTGRRHKQ